MKITEFEMRKIKAFIILVIFMAAASSVQATPALVTRLVSVDNDTRASALQEASLLSPKEQKPVVSALIDILEAQDAERSEHAAEALGQLGDAAYIAMPALRKGLGAEFPYIRSSCSEALLKMSPASIPEFIKALKSDNLDVRSIAAAALEKIGSSAAPAIPALVEALDDRESIIRTAAGRALTRIGSQSVPVLESALANPHFHNRIGAIQALSNIDESTPDLADHLVVFLGEGDTQLRMSVIKILGHKGEASVPALRKTLGSTNAFASSGAADAIADIGPKAAPAVPELATALQNTDVRVRRSAARALGNIGFGAGAAVPALEVAVKDPDKEVSVRASEALASITVFTKEGKRVTMDKAQALAIAASKPKDQQNFEQFEGQSPEAKPISSGARVKISKATEKNKNRPSKPTSPRNEGSISESAWLKRCASDDSTVRTAAAQSFAASVNTALLAARKSLDSDDWHLRECACQTLGLLGAKGKPSLEGLDQASRDSMVAVRLSAVQAMGTIDSNAAKNSLVSATTDKDAGVRLAAITALGTLGPGNVPPIAPVEARVHDSNSDVQSAAIHLLETLGTPEAKKALAPYYEDIRNRRINALVEQIRLSTRTIEASDIAELVRLAPSSIMPVASLLPSTKMQVRLLAAQILNRLGALSAPATQPLIGALQDPDETVRQQSAQALEKIGSPETKNPLRLYYVKEKARLYLKKMNLGGN